MQATRAQKHPSEAENGMNESIYWKKFTPYQIQLDSSYNLRVESYDFWGHRGHSCAKRAKRLGTRKTGVPSDY